MNETKPTLVEALFELAAQKPTAAARAEFLDGVCRDNPSLRARLEVLLEGHFAGDGFLTRAPERELPAAVTTPRSEEAPAEMIGRYKLLEKIGEGGFGEVWMAEQREPVKRRVALKIIKLGMDSWQIVARFEAERQALAMMDHPNIAKIFDADVTDTGRLYFVMELVRGIKITEYCDQNQLPTQERLRLFILVCQAIQHAHQKGIIHRDIKPSNILVTLHDGVAVPKVIDFGIAKATQQELTDKTVFTQFQQFIGTPAYISPEQAEMSGLDIDTRADIYSLGVLLYELLVGQTPFDAKDMMQGGLDALRQIIREKSPLRPSTKLSQTLVAAKQVGRVTPPCAPSVEMHSPEDGAHGVTRPNSKSEEEEVKASSRRLLRLKETIALLRGDLDWIVMKCLEKDRARRYETANGLAMDIQRHLSHEPVAARPPSHLYKLQKFARRNKTAVLAAAVIVFALMLGLGASTLALLGERRAHSAAAAARDMAEKERQSAESARARAEENALTARRNAYAADMFAAQQAFENGNLGRARDLLKAHWPKPDEPDLRGFEWRYLGNLCRGDNFHTLPGHSNRVKCVAFSPDGKTLASGGGDSLVKMWDVANRRLMATLLPHRVAWLAFSNDGETLATAGDDGLKLWNVKTHQLIFTLNEKQAARIAFSPVGTLLAIGYGHPVFSDRIGGPIKLWDYVTHQVVRTFPEPGSRLAFSPDGKMLAARSTNDAVKLWSLKTGDEIGKLDHAGDVLCLSFSPDGQTVATGNWAGEVKLWNVATGERMLPLQGHTTIVWSLAFSPDGRILATASADQSVRLWNVASGKEESKLIGHGSAVNAVAFAPDGQTLATGGDDSTVMLWSTAQNGAEVVITNVHQAPTFSLDSNLLATSRKGGPVTVWDVATRQPVWVLESEKFAKFPDEGRTLASISTNGILRYWDVATQTLQRAVPLAGITDSTQRFRFALRGNRLAAADNDGFVTLCDATTGGLIGKFKASTEGYWLSTEALTFSPDARLLATSGESNPVRLWDVATQKELTVVSSHKGSAQGLAFSPDGSILASASWDDDTVGFLRVATGKAEAPLTGINEGCSGVAFAPDDRTLAVACEDGTFRLWNLATKREVVVLKHGKAPLRFVVFSPDGQTLVSVCENGTMRFWDAPSPEVPHPRKEE